MSDDEQAEGEQQLAAKALGESTECQQALWNALLSDELACTRRPRVAAHAVAEVLAKWLVAMEATDPNERPFCDWLVDQIRTQVRAHRPPAPTEMRH